MSDQAPRYRLGVDIGGTFTDVLIFDDVSGALTSLKVPSNRQDPEQAIITGLEALRDRHQVDPGQIGYFSHGTTLGVNTLLERDGAEVGLLVTKGFRDILELRRLRLPQANNLYAPRPRALVPRRRVAEINERVGFDGRVIVPVDHEDVLTQARALFDGGAENIAICFLHAYRNGDHEALVRQWILESFPEAYVIASAELWPQQREYERALVSVINGYIGARMGRYFKTLKDKAAASGVGARIFSTKSNGGVMSVEAASLRPVETLLSGPASGVIGAAFIGRLIGDTRLLTLDMGGTSVDMALVDGEVPYSNENTVGEFTVVLPAVDVSAIGAGGGSIAWLDAEGVLKVGPRSAGAYPGPACYGRGGTEPTVTDAYATLGIMTSILGGEMQLHLDKARAALATIGTRLGLTVEQTADAVLQVATANIYAEAVPQLARRGVDAKDFSLLCYGAAGPTHSFMLARELNLRRVIVPPMPGLLCALGCLVADLRADFVRSLWHDSRAMSDEQINATFAQFTTEAENWLAAQKVDVVERRILRSIDMCYQGQSFELNVILPDGPLTIAQIETLFHDHYERVYGYADRASPLRILEARLQIIGSTRKPDFSRLRPFAGAGGAAPVTRRIYENGKSGEAVVYTRASLGPGFRFEGPAIVEQYDTTVYVPAGFRATVDPWYNIIGERMP
jgi:N-methylhydantoinase A